MCIRDRAKYIHTTADLASEIWREVYKRYYPGKQLDTLVEELQSAEAIEADIDMAVCTPTARKRS